MAKRGDVSVICSDRNRADEQGWLAGKSKVPKCI